MSQYFDNRKIFHLTHPLLWLNWAWCTFPFNIISRLPDERTFIRKWFFIPKHGLYEIGSICGWLEPAESEFIFERLNSRVAECKDPWGWNHLVDLWYISKDEWMKWLTNFSAIENILWCSSSSLVLSSILDILTEESGHMTTYFPMILKLFMSPWMVVKMPSLTVTSVWSSVKSWAIMFVDWRQWERGYSLASILVYGRFE